MRKVVLIIIPVAVVILAVVMASLNQNQVGIKDSTSNSPEISENLKSEDSIQNTEDTDTKMIDEVPVSRGAYIPYDSNKLTDKTNILFFAAMWCPSCRALDQDIEKNRERIPGELTILKVDFDTEQSLKVKYGITIQHTLVQVDKKGNQINKWTGLYSISSLNDILKLL